MVKSAEWVFGEKLCMQKFKINRKMDFEGGVQLWHQDYGAWINDDMKPEPRSMDVAIFLDDANQPNVPLMIIQGSRKRGVPKIGHDLAARSYPFWGIGNQQIRQLV